MKLSLNYLATIIGVFAFTACTDLLNSSIPRSGYTVHKDIAYGDNARQRMDIYTPDNLQKPASVIVFFYGGAWKMGSKEDYRFVGQAFASKGYITVIADYRLYPEIRFPAFMHDGANAFAWTHAHIAEYGGDPDKLFLAGHSAGAYIAVMLTVDDQFINAAKAKRSWIKGTIGIAGPYDFLPFTDPKIKDTFSPVKDTLTQPINYVTAGLPPMLLVTGSDDRDVYPKNTYNMTAKLREYNDKVTDYTYPGVAHIGIILSLANGFRSKAPLLEDIDRFISGTP